MNFFRHPLFQMRWSKRRPFDLDIEEDIGPLSLLPLVLVGLLLVAIFVLGWLLFK